MTLAEITGEGKRLVKSATEAVNNVEFGLGTLSASDLQHIARIIRKLRFNAGDFI